MSQLSVQTARLMSVPEKDDAIAFVCAYVPAVHREVLYRLWARYHRTSVLRSDLERLKEANARHQQQRDLF
jgi:hypothetical protein